MNTQKNLFTNSKRKSVTRKSTTQRPENQALAGFKIFVGGLHPASTR